MRSSLYKLARVSAFIFTIEWFYRLGTTNVNAVFVGLSMISLLILLCAFFFYQFRYQAGQRVLQWTRVSMIVLFFMMFGSYGYYRGVHEIVTPPVIGQPIRTIGRVISVHSMKGQQVADLILTKIDVSNHVENCKISVSYSSSLRSLHTLSTAQNVQLTGVILSIDEVKGRTASPLLHLLSPTYQFEGRVERIWNTKNRTNWITGIRRDLHDSAVSSCGQDEQSKTMEAILESIVFGGNNVPHDLHTVFLQAGVLHVLAASGANMLFMERVVSRVFWSLCRFIPLGTYVAEICVLVFIWFYALLCDIQPSILRAAWMSSYRVLGQMAGRESSTFSSLIFSGFCTALMDPGELWTMGSILSYSATFALDKAVRYRFYAHKQKQKKQKRFRFRTMVHFFITYIKKAASMSLWVESYTAPLCEALFGQWTPYGVLSNLFVEPILSILLPLAAFWFLFNLSSKYIPVFYLPDQLFTSAVFAILRLFIDGLTYISHLPFALVRLPAVPVVVLFTYYLAITILPMIYRIVQTKQNRGQGANSGFSVETL